MKLFILGYLLLLNLLSWYAMYDDKRKSINGEWRTSESSLLFFCFVGGFIGIYLGMKYCRHKTKHWQFHVAVVVSTLLWLIVLPLGGYWLFK